MSFPSLRFPKSRVGARCSRLRAPFLGPMQLALPLAFRRETPGWGPWSTKDGVIYAHAPAAALQQVLALRVHLDPSTAMNGPLRVIPGTHELGVLTDEGILRQAGESGAIACTVGAGGVVAMRPPSCTLPPSLNPTNRGESYTSSSLLRAASATGCGWRWFNLRIFVLDLAALCGQVGCDPSVVSSALLLPFGCCWAPLPAKPRRPSRR
jgi:phytanoyl-CoA dioxygenase PhyH